MKPVPVFLKDELQRIAAATMLKQARSALEEATGIAVDAGCEIVGNSDKGLDLNGLPISDISSLKGFPLNILYLHDTQVSDLTPLTGMPLKKIKIHGTPATDLEPLRGMPLENIHMWGTMVSSLEPLRGMPIKTLYAEGMKLQDISPLKGMPIENLSLSATEITNIDVLTGMDLDELRLDCRLLDESAVEQLVTFTNLTRLVIPSHWQNIERLRELPNLLSLSHKYDGWKTSAKQFWVAWDQRDAGEATQKPPPQKQPTQTAEVARQAIELASGISIPSSRLRGGPNGTGLDLRGLAIKDLSPLIGHPLTTLYLDGTDVSDLTPLAEMPLTTLLIANTPVSDLEPLKGMPIENLHIWNSAVTSIEPLRGMPIRTLIMESLKIQDISPLKDMPLKVLSLSATEITDVNDIPGTDLVELRLDCRLLDESAVEQLGTFTNLTRLVIPAHWQNIDTLRDHPNIRNLSHKFDRWKTSSQQFWTARDQQNDTDGKDIQPE